MASKTPSVNKEDTKLIDFSPESDKYEDIKVIRSDVYAGLESLDDNIIQCAVTSPPYWDQRDYGFEGQIGNEETYAEYIEKLEAVYRKLKDKLHPQGIFFLNIGDKRITKYSGALLEMIPYKLAKFMRDNGWILADTIIWYKPNPSPGNPLNRFHSTYEPVFVFAKNKTNYYSEYIKGNKKYSNVFEIQLQQTKSSSHVAPYPEELIEKLLKLGFPKDSLVLDPFAGSGTTAKAMQNLNQKERYNMKSILIEGSEEYVEIIREKCLLSSKQEIIEFPFKEYETRQFVEGDSV